MNETSTFPSQAPQKRKPSVMALKGSPTTPFRQHDRG